MHYHTLSEKEGLGRVVTCEKCSDIHVSLKNLTLSLSREEFFGMAELVQKALQEPRVMFPKDVSLPAPKFNSLFSLA